MSEPVGAIAQVMAELPADEAAPAAATAPAGADFAKWLDAKVGGVNAQLVAAEQGLRELAAGGTASLHEVMMRAEEARLSFQLLVQMRNRVLEAYQDILRMQA